MAVREESWEPESTWHHQPSHRRSLGLLSAPVFLALAALLIVGYQRTLKHVTLIADGQELQRVESDLVIQQVGGRLAGNGPFISLHDSVFCRRDDLAVVESAFEHATKTVGFRVKLKAA